MWTWIVQLAMKLVMTWLNAAEERKDAKKSFLKFVDTLEKGQLMSVSLNESNRSQLDDLRNQ